MPVINMEKCVEVSCAEVKTLLTQVSLETLSLTFSPPFSWLSLVACLSAAESRSISKQNAVVIEFGVKGWKF